MLGYDYPPSKFLSSFGTFQEDTHYLGKGILIAENSRFRCIFECAYTQSYQIIVVCYFSIEFDFPTEKVFRLIGKATPNEFTLVAENLLPFRSEVIYERKTHHGDIEYLCTVVFTASCYKVFAPYTNLGKISPRKFTHFDLTTLELPPTEKSGNMIIFSLDQENSREILLTYNNAQREHDPISSTLVIPIDSIPNGWTEIEVAEMWCALLSLALGSDIHWIKSYIPTTPHPGEITWQAKKVSITKKFIHRLFYNLQGENLDQAKEFIKICFSFAIANNITKDQVNQYLRIIRTYIFYVLAEMNTQEGEARLITTLVEELLFIWERHNKQNKLKKIITESERKQLENAIKATMIEKVDEYLSQGNKQNLDQIITRTIEQVHYVEKPFLEERLQNFFDTYKYSSTQSEFSEKVIQFIKTRNKIAHQGEFASKKQADIPSEITNMRRILPIMIFCIFGYGEKYANSKHPLF